MKLSYLSQTWFPFLVPEKDATFASSVGPQTVYPAGFSLEQALQIYWRAKDYRLIATGGGTLSGVTQALAINQLLPTRNAGVGTNVFFELEGLELNGPGDLVTGVGLAQIITGAGTITASGSTNPDAVFNMQVFLFYPEIFAPDPVVKFDGKWWPAMSVSCSVTNTVTLSGGGELEIAYSCDSYDPASTTEIGAFSFFGASVPVYCGVLGSGETRTFSGSLAVEDEWP
jgi:hypothetical protein